MAESDPRRPRLLIANIEAASMVSDRFRNLLKKYVAQRRAEIVVDESTTIKGNTALRTKFAVNTLNPLSSYRRILSGLPTPNSPLDLYCQFAFLDRSILGFGTYTEFRARYAIMGFIRVQNRLQEIVKDYQNVEELYAKIEPHSYRIRLSDIAEIPATYRRRPIELTPDQKTAYRQLRELAYAELADASLVTAQLVIVRMLRLHQILLGHVVDSDGELKEIGERRTGELLELLDDYDGKAIIWCSYDYNVRRVSEALRKNFGEDSVAQFWGRNISSREEEDKRFRTDPRCRFMVATPASGGRGRRWDVADLVVYFSNTANLEHRDQSEERVKDVERTKAVSYVDFIAEGTVEEKIIEALRRKINLAAVVTGDNFREWLV
jgi:SNF2 family DNA or RNA helicase